jgi:3-oxoacyl-[acyl-carrier-protein] synthase II
MMVEREVLITGIGLISSLGIGKAENWENLCEGRSGIRLIKRFDTADHRTKFGGEIPDEFGAFVSKRFPVRTRKHTAFFSQLCLSGTHLALEDSGLVIENEDPTTIGICIGTGAGGLSYWEQSFIDSGGYYADALHLLESLAVIKYMSNAPSAITSQHFGIEGPSLAVSSACSSGAHAIGCAYDMLKLGRAEVVIAGGVDSVISRVSLSSFNKLLALSERNDDPQRASRPFDKLRDGFVLGDGAGILVLETAEHCRKRGAKPYAKICGYAMTGEAYHMVHPAENGRKMAETMSKALKDAAVAPDQVDYISAHGTSTILNDKYETAAIKEVFGPHAYKLAISSQKSMIGHTVGAAGAIELAVTALTVASNMITPTINYEYPDEECDLDYTPNVAREREVRVALSNSFGFGGHNCSIVIAKP